MAKQKNDNNFKVMMVELLNYGVKTSQAIKDYCLNVSMLSLWIREHIVKSGDFSKKRVVSKEEQ